MSYRIISVDKTNTPKLLAYVSECWIETIKQLGVLLGIKDPYPIPIEYCRLATKIIGDNYTTLMVHGPIADYYIVDTRRAYELCDVFLNIKIESARHGISYKGLEPVPRVMEESLPFEVIWQTIKQWVISIPHMYEGELNATGSHVKLILDALAENHLVIKRKD